MPTNKTEYMKKYYETHKVKILTKMSEQKECQFCNKMIVCSHIARHEKSKKCQLARMEKQIPITTQEIQTITKLKNQMQLLQNKIDEIKMNENPIEKPTEIDETL